MKLYLIEIDLCVILIKKYKRGIDEIKKYYKV